ncbi:hypothetical protein P9139_18085 [Curtobacterium flaccumfaciens]|nr:hypothetical protein P9139_18085 [Curtobacterium flaccumfaciens]
MPRFKTDQGVTVDVSEELAARIGGKWEPVKPATTSRTKKSED